MDSPIRILVIVKWGALAWREAWEEPTKIITQVLRNLKYDSLVTSDEVYHSFTCRFVAVERWDTLTLPVFDLFNTTYNHLDAHLDDKNELPVRVVRISQGEHSDVIKSKKPRAIGQVTTQLRHIHDGHGWNQGPPYKIDHANGVHPVYWSPRSLKPRP